MIFSNFKNVAIFYVYEFNLCVFTIVISRFGIISEVVDFFLNWLVGFFSE